jgi:hypothetical protein
MPLDANAAPSHPSLLSTQSLWAAPWVPRSRGTTQRSNGSFPETTQRGNDPLPGTAARHGRPSHNGLASPPLLAPPPHWDTSAPTQLLYVANLHLEGSPYRPNDRINQTRSALQRLEAHQRQHGVAPGDAVVIVCGDLNSGRHETVCHFLHRCGVSALPPGLPAWPPSRLLSCRRGFWPSGLLACVLARHGRQRGFASVRR